MLGSLIADRRDGAHRCTVFRSGDPPEIERWLADRGVAVESRRLPAGGPPPFLEIAVGDEVVGVIAIDAVEGLIEPPIVRPGEGDGVSEGYRALFDVLGETVVSGASRRELLAVSREIEDRAYRVGDGTLRASFQALSNFESQAEVYRSLASDTTLEIHVYGVEDWTPPAIPGLSYHVVGAERFERCWALAYDGGPDGAQACGLVAEELSDGYTGFWTSDSAIVEKIAAALESV